jgi:hypothetical protein
VLAWWISASSALRDPRRDRGLPPWNMTPSRTQNEAPLPLPPPPLFQALEPIKNTQRLGQGAEGAGSSSRSNEQAKARQGEGQQEKKRETQAALVWVCGKVVLGEGNCERGALCPSCVPLGFYISKECRRCLGNLQIVFAWFA